MRGPFDGAFIMDDSQREGTSFGESCALKMQSLEYFGDIYAGASKSDADSSVSVLTISREAFERIPYHEQKLMKKAHAAKIRPYQMVAANLVDLNTDERNLY
jgi:hypothetical protein